MSGGDCVGCQKGVVGVRWMLWGVRIGLWSVMWCCGMSRRLCGVRRGCEVSEGIVGVRRGMSGVGWKLWGVMGCRGMPGRDSWPSGEVWCVGLHEGALWCLDGLRGVWRGGGFCVTDGAVWCQEWDVVCQMDICKYIKTTHQYSK